MRTLLIEDNPGDARLMQTLLSEASSESTVQVAERLELGLQCLSGQVVDVVVLDLGLPDSWGLETLTKLQTRYPHLPVVILTGTDDQALGVQAVQLGAQDYLVKGKGDGRLLQRALTYAVERKRAEQRIQEQARELQVANTKLQQQSAELEQANIQLEEALDQEHTARAVAEDRQRILAERERALEDAMSQVEKLNRDLEQQAVELQAANQELESFAYSISHDLRMPLTSITQFANLVIRDYGNEITPDARQFVELIRGNGTAMTQLVEGLLRFSRSGREPVRKQPTDMQDLVRRSLDDLSALQEGRHIEIAYGDLPACQADPVLLKQVMVNLLSNALKFTRPRDVTRIEIGARTVDGESQYYVRDNGVGFDSAQAERLFGVFQRLHSEEEYEGTGIGLAIVERIIRRHGGRVWAEGEVGKGATFYFTLPT